MHPDDYDVDADDRDELETGSARDAARALLGFTARP